MARAPQLRHIAFLSHTDQNEQLGSVEVTQAVHAGLRSKRLLSFFDVRSLPPGTQWAHKIELLVATSRVFVAVISPHYCHRYWPMRELDIALHEPPGAGGGDGGVLVPVLVGVATRDIGSRVFLEGCRAAWARMLDEHPERAQWVNMQRWENNIRRLKDWQAVDGSKHGLGVAKGCGANVAQAVVDVISNYVAPARS